MRGQRHADAEVPWHLPWWRAEKGSLPACSRTRATWPNRVTPREGRPASAADRQSIFPASLNVGTQISGPARPAVCGPPIGTLLIAGGPAKCQVDAWRGTSAMPQRQTGMEKRDDPAALLLSCRKCEQWPAALSSSEPGNYTFQCPRCGTHMRFNRRRLELRIEGATEGPEQLAR
jgi:hypothetical protein